jgi:adenylylsulfate kinase
MKILICGLPGSGKSTLAEPFAELIGGVWLNADQIRTQYDDWDFSIKGRLRQTLRMCHLADGVVMAGKIAVADFVCPTQLARDWFNADYTVWMDTIKKSQYEDTNVIFVKPDHYDYHVSSWFNDTHTELVKVVTNYMQKQDDIKNDRIEGATSGRL